MKLNYSNEPPVLHSHSIFLAGPTPRKKEVPSWRPEALEVLRNLDFQGIVYIPEHQEVTKNYDYLTQVEWEYECLEKAGAICFWIPRKLPDMPAFTTNVEFGRYIGSGKAFYGRPDWAEKKGYLDWLNRKLNKRDPFTNMETMFREAIHYLTYKLSD